MAVKIFFCYARKDKKYLEQLKEHLSPWIRQGRITMWYDECISAGRDWEREIRFHMSNAQVIVLLVSSKFISSDFCYSEEMMQAMERYKSGEVHIIPVILSSVHWKETPFGHLRALPKNGKPVTDPSWGKQNDAFYDVAMSIYETLCQDFGSRGLFSASDMAILASLPAPVAHHISRRVVLAALLGGMTVTGAAGGYIYWLNHNQKQQAKKSKQPLLFQGKLPYTYSKHTDIVSSVSWSPDELYIVSGSHDKTAHVWDAMGNTRHIYYGHVDKINAVKWSPKGIYIASASSDKTVHIWNSAIGETVKIYKGHSAAVNALAWSPDGKQIVSASDDGTAQIWDALTGEHILTYPLNTPSHSLQPIKAVDWSSDGMHITSGNMNNLFDIWNVATGNVVASHHTNGLPVLAWSANGKAIVIGGQHISLSIDDIKGNSLYHYQDTISASVLSVACSPIEQVIALGGSDSIVRLWNPLVRLDNSAFIYKYQGHKGPVRGVAYSPDGFYIASCSEDKTVQVWYPL